MTSAKHVDPEEIEVSPDRIKAVEQPEEEGTPGKMWIVARESEIEALSATGAEELAAGQKGDDDDSFRGKQVRWRGETREEDACGGCACCLTILELPDKSGD